MKITKTASYDITFSVQYFLPTEGGMDNESYGEVCQNLEEAIHLRELAISSYPKTNWIIVGHVKNTISSK